MGGFSIWHWLVVLIVVILLFGRGRIADVMGDFAKGIKSFKKGLADDEPQPTSSQTAQHLPPQGAPVDAKSEVKDRV
jgi:sec-independent protein translocase protein TatA